MPLFATIDSIYRYPVKGLTPEPLSRAELNVGQKRIPEAVELLDKARAMNPNVREIYELLGAQFMTMGDYRSALRVLKAGIELFPDDASLRALDQKARSATLDGMTNQ